MKDKFTKISKLIKKLKANIFFNLLILMIKLK